MSLNSFEFQSSRKRLIRVGLKISCQMLKSVFLQILFMTDNIFYTHMTYTRNIQFEK